MALTDAEKKRRSRASKPRAYHDRERETSRRRMALGRARNRAQKRASQLRSLLNDKDRRAFGARAAKEKQRLVCEWFGKKQLRFDPEVINDKKILNVFMTKLDLYRIETQVAEFEISLMGIEEIEDDAEEKNIASLLDKEKEMPSSDVRGKEVRDILDAKQEEVARPRPTSDVCGKEVREILDAKQEEVAKPGCPGTKDQGGSRFLEKEMPNSDIYGKDVPEILGLKQEEVANPQIDRLLEKEMEEVREILGVKREEVAKPGYPGTDDLGELQRWDDEVLAAEAMAMMQTSQGGKTNSL